MDLIYPCKCRGECTPEVTGLSNCIMRSNTPDTYCKWCMNNLNEKDTRKRYRRVAYETK